MNILEQALDVLSQVEALPEKSASYALDRLESARRLRAISRAMEIDAHQSVDYDVIGDPRKSIDGRWC